jgi:hypothetical protein
VYEPSPRPSGFRGLFVNDITVLPPKIRITTLGQSGHHWIAELDENSQSESAGCGVAARTQAVNRGFTPNL